MFALIEITAWHWAGFIACVLFFLALDLGVFHRQAHVVKFKEALGWTFAWIALALVFNAGVYHWFGAQKGSASRSDVTFDARSASLFPSLSLALAA